MRIQPHPLRTRWVKKLAEAVRADQALDHPFNHLVHPFLMTNAPRAPAYSHIVTLFILNRLIDTVPHPYPLNRDGLHC